MINFIYRIVNGKNKVNPVVKELINFTKSKNPESFKVMDLVPELNKFQLTAADLDALEKALDEKNNWHPVNRDYWEKVIVEILQENGREIKN